MALTLTRDLEQYVPDSGSPPIESRWVAVHNPVLLTWQRKDYETTTAYAGSGFLRLQFSAPTGASSGDLIYVNCPGAYIGLANITGFATNDIITDVPISLAMGTYPGYVNNLTQRANYFVEIQITTPSASSTPDADDILASLFATPDTTGLVKVDISGALQSYTSNPDTLDLPVSAGGEADGGSQVTFKYRAAERWRPASGLVEQPYGSYSSNSYGVNGAFQAGHEFNGNYAEYYPNVDNPGLFITDFTRGRYWAGYPFDVAFIYPEGYDLFTTNIVTSFFNSAGVQIGGSAAALDTADVGKVCRIEPDNDLTSWGEPVAFAQVQMRIDSPDNRILQVWQYDVVNADDVPCDGVYLQWLGRGGNRSYWLFNNKYGESLQVDGGDTYQAALDAIDDLTDRANWYEKKPFKKLTIGAESLTRSEIEGLKTLLTSTKVDALEADGAGWKRTGVLVEPGTFTIGRGDDSLFKIELTIVFPEQFNQTA
jgi:hypothetical protein